MREARLSEIKRELLNSKKLASYFEDNPRERDMLKHDKASHTHTNTDCVTHNVAVCY